MHAGDVEVEAVAPGSNSFLGSPVGAVVPGMYQEYPGKDYIPASITGGPPNLVAIFVRLPLHLPLPFLASGTKSNKFPCKFC